MLREFSLQKRKISFYSIHQPEGSQNSPTKTLEILGSVYSSSTLFFLDLTQPQCINNKHILNFLYGRRKKGGKKIQTFCKPRNFLCETRDMNIESPNIENLVRLCLVWTDQGAFYLHLFPFIF